MKDRLKYVRKELGLTQKGFAEKLGITQAALNEIEHGRSGLTKSRLSQIAHVFNVNPEWLTTGQGGVFLEGKTPDEEDAAAFSRVLERLVKGLSKDDQRVVIESAEYILREFSPSSLATRQTPPNSSLEEEPTARETSRRCMELHVTNVHGNLMGVAFDHSSEDGRHMTIIDSSRHSMNQKFSDEITPKRRRRTKKESSDDGK